ncbi:hypothetical protein MRB56_15470 [Halomonas cupida]|uniref:hypothetical protein n=1 Tax=Halomonas cupida TaxID=44933 RepID=UPI0039B47BC2
MAPGGSFRECLSGMLGAQACATMVSTHQPGASYASTPAAATPDINPACFYAGLMAAQGRAAVGHQADARPHHTSRSAHLRQWGCGRQSNRSG